MHISHYAILGGDAGYVEDGPHIVVHGENGSGSFTILYCNVMYIEHARMHF